MRRIQEVKPGIYTSAFDQACFLMSIPFALLTLACFGLALLFQTIAKTLDPSWEEE